MLSKDYDLFYTTAHLPFRPRGEWHEIFTDEIARILFTELGGYVEVSEVSEQTA